MTPNSVIAKVADLAAGQWGLLTTRQAAHQEISRLQLSRLARAGVIERVGHGVYSMASNNDPHVTLRAAWLTLDPDLTAEERLSRIPETGVTSHAAAAGLHGLGDLLDDEPEFTLPYRKQTSRAIKLHKAELSSSDVTLVEGLPTTTVERTIRDLLREGNDTDLVAQILGQAVRRQSVDIASLASSLDSIASRFGQPDGSSFVEYLLDLTGLGSKTALQSLASSDAGRALVAAGRASIVQELLGQSGLVSVGQKAADSVGINKLLESIAPTLRLDELLASARQPVTARLAESFMPKTDFMKSTGLSNVVTSPQLNVLLKEPARELIGSDQDTDAGTTENEAPDEGREA
ncbi:hypothetical protein GCM10022261_09190 [Brevibacterium daeguense]|uniref:AbiEi antitoxin N-terminal domain-containing protein n=1 Tax=Brevibacterium daeguense TaxID=909936 RepID=A0ABP8EHJ6_9MICO|nr:type IV toxin-antitoxin system AbiEi family antitoxin domain-containing protein [Brevibacterium daeguense]